MDSVNAPHCARCHELCVRDDEPSLEPIKMAGGEYVHQWCYLVEAWGEAWARMVFPRARVGVVN